jgi:uncharacterized protein YqgQ
MSKLKRSDKPAALDHVLYEIEMLTHSLIALYANGYSTPQKNAWLECFAIHARNLNEFFGKTAAGKSYMQPGHFVPWKSSYTFNSDLARRASAHMAHLIYDRERPEEKAPWPIPEIFKSLREPSLAFLRAVAADRPLMAYDRNRERTESLLAELPKIVFSETQTSSLTNRSS